LENVLLVSLVPVVHHDLQISSHIRKNGNDSMLFSGAWGKKIHEKNLKLNIL
jgi:hypothetical protein